MVVNIPYLSIDNDTLIMDFILVDKGGAIIILLIELY
jgi:hypothetical protein